VFSQLNKMDIEPVDFSNFFRGGVVKGSNTAFPFIRRDLLLNYTALRNEIDSEPLLANNHPWNPRGNLDGTGAYHPEDISDITEKTSDAYLRLDFGKAFGNSDMSIDGNVGVRFTKTTLDSSGALSYQAFNADTQNTSQADIWIDPNNHALGRKRTDDAESHDDPRDFLPETTAFLQQAATPITTNLSNSFYLPSLNVKWNLNKDMLVRFGASKGLTRPNVQDLRASQLVQANTSRTNYPTVQPPCPNPADLSNCLVGVDQGAQDIRLSQISVSRGNPLLNQQRQ